MNFAVIGGSELTLMPRNSPPAFDPLRFVTPVASPRSRHTLVAEIAYFRALARGFAPGHDVEDWLAAEAEVDKRYGAHYEI
jgi:hypothetical protein